MLLLAHDSELDAKVSAQELNSLGAVAVKLLCECVEHQGLTRQRTSKAALALESKGFLFIRDRSSIWNSEYHLSPSLAGEEALEALQS